MKTVRVIPQRIAIEPDGKQYSMYGSLSKGTIIKESGKYTWEINNNGTLTIGLGRQPVDSNEEAIQFAKDLSKLGYTYIE